MLSFRPLRTLLRNFGAAAFLLFALTATLCFARPAAAADPVSAEARMVAAATDDGIAEVRIDVAVEEGWHVNSDEPGLEFLIPTGVELKMSDGLMVEEIRYPEPVLRKLKLAGEQQIALFEGEFSIVARVSSRGAAADTEDIVVNLRYQACNDTVCLRPATVTLPVAAGGGRDASSRIDGDDFAFRIAGDGGKRPASGLPWTTFTAEAYLEAVHERRPFVMGFSADWCLPCREMYERTYKNASVIEAGKGIRFLEVDTTETTDFVSRVMESFDVKALPTTLFFDADGRELARRGGFISATEFAKLLNEVKRASSPPLGASQRAI